MSENVFCFRFIGDNAHCLCICLPQAVRLTTWEEYIILMET